MGATIVSFVLPVVGGLVIWSSRSVEMDENAKWIINGIVMVFSLMALVSGVLLLLGVGVNE